jgi:hypothetical protein
VDANHQLIVKNFEEEVNNSMENPLERQFAKKKAYNEWECKCNLQFFWGHTSLPKG